MGTIDAQGIYKYASNDIVAPLETALNVGQQSVSDALAALGPGTTRYVANTSARNALAASYAPTATKPLYVYRGDAPVGYNFEFTFDGSVWYTIPDSRSIGSWVACTSVSGFNAANFHVRKNGLNVDTRGRIIPTGTGSINTTFITIAQLPAGFEPTTTIQPWPGATTISTTPNYQITTAGEIQVRGFVSVPANYTASSSFAVSGWPVG